MFTNFVNLYESSPISDSPRSEPEKDAANVADPSYREYYRPKCQFCIESLQICQMSFLEDV